MKKILFILLISLFVSGLNAQNITLTIQPSDGNNGIATDIANNIVAFDLLIEVDQPEWQLRSYNVWTQYPKPSMSYNSDASAIAQDAGDTDNDLFGQYRLGGANGFTTLEANTPTIFHTVAYNFSNANDIMGQTMIVGGDAILFGLSFSTTITLVNEYTNVALGFVITDANELTIVPSTFPSIFGSMPLIDLGSCKTRYIGYPPADNGVEIQAIVTNGSAPYTYSWSPAEYITSGINTSSVVVNPLVSTDYVLEVTDANGVIVSSSVFVDVINVLSSGISSMDDPDIIICHKPKEIGAPSVQMIVPMSSVPLYLKHGDHLGPCNSACVDDDSFIINQLGKDYKGIAQFENWIEANPNPTKGATRLTYKVYTDQNVLINLVDISGKTVKELFSGNVSADEENYLDLDLNLKAGVYFVRMFTETEILNYKIVIVK